MGTEGSEKDRQGKHGIFSLRNRISLEKQLAAHFIVCFLMKEIHGLPLGNFSTQNLDKKVTIKKFDLNAYKENISIGLTCQRMKKRFERMTLSEWTLSLCGNWEALSQMVRNVCIHLRALSNSEIVWVGDSDDSN